MGDPATSGVYRLDVAVDASSLATARLFVGVVLRTIGRHEASSDDLKLVVTEVLTSLVKGGASTAASIVVDPAQRVVTVEPVDGDALTPESDAYLIVTTLFPGANLDLASRRLIVPIPSDDGVVDGA